MLQRLINYLNPIAHLGDKRYSIIFPAVSMFLILLISEGISQTVLKDLNVYGAFIILISITSIIYFAFRSGIRGGVIATIFTVAYYFYIIYSRNYSGQQFVSGIQTTIVLGFLYLLMGWIIGWLKQTIDTFIDSEANERRRMQSIIQQLPVGVLITDNTGKVLQVNKRLETIIGARIPIGHVMGIDGLPLKSTHKGGVTGPSHSPLAQALKSGRSVVGKEFIIDRKDGKNVHVQVSASPIHDRKGKIIAAASIVTDITAQKEMEERKDDFVNMASHELKTPITSLKLYIDLLGRHMKKYKDAQLAKTLGNIKNQTERLQELVSDLLDVSRLQTGKLTFARESFRMDELIAETAEELREMTRNQKIIFTKKSPVVVHADKFRMYQVLTNLLTNAIKYSPEGRNIEITIGRKAGKAVISVRDYGIGIAKDQQKKIFDRLYQVVDSTEKTFPGFGMGLYISKEIIKRHRGTIWVESEGKEKNLPEGRQGSTFFFSLPLPAKTK